MAKQEKKRGWPSADAKWTYKVGQHGYTAIPNILFWYAARLDISPSQQAVLFQLLSRWWDANKPPVVSKAKLAEGLGISARQVQRNLRALEEKGLIESNFPNRPGRHPNEFTFDGLVKKLEKIAVGYGRMKRQHEHKIGQAAKSASKTM